MKIYIYICIKCCYLYNPDLNYIRKPQKVHKLTRPLLRILEIIITTLSNKLYVLWKAEEMFLSFENFVMEVLIELWISLKHSILA